MLHMPAKTAASDIADAAGITGPPGPPGPVGLGVLSDTVIFGRLQE